MKNLIIKIFKISKYRVGSRVILDDFDGVFTIIKRNLGDTRYPNCLYVRDEKGTNLFIGPLTSIKKHEKHPHLH